ncbi:YiiD C-terminal domain-containing protein [Sphingobacterium sp. Mn56C]|uniref:YiiD C-terminal domain-containing protein n=1 Tax=Sphingobacterium sp. Mn56C TaxID=3395261 RepID=UPI003BDFF3E9
MKFTPSSLKWLLRSYPPFLFQRIWVKRIHKDFKGIDVKIYKNILNINSNRTIFGGTIFSAIDPVHPILIDQILRARGITKTIAWLKSAKIEYLKPGRTDLQFSIKLNDTEIQEAFDEIQTRGKVVKTFVTEVFDKNGIKCAICHNEIYIRNLNFGFRN